jgi:hypothetical protein
MMNTMRVLKILCSLVCFLLFVAQVWSISRWNEARGVYDDICYLRQAHLFQRFGTAALDTDIARDDDNYLVTKLREIAFPLANDKLNAPCHTPMPKTGKFVLQYPPGTGFLLSLFPEGFQVIPLYVLATVAITGFALFALWRARRPGPLALAAVFGAMSIYFMINPTKASYSLAPTMVVCALAGLLTVRLFVDEGRRLLFMTAAVGMVLGLSVNFRIANAFLAAGYFVFFGLSFLTKPDRAKFLQGLSFGLAFLVGLLPVLAANMVNSGNPLVSVYGGQDTAPPSFDQAVLRAYLTDMQFPLIVIICIWTVVAWRLGTQSGVRRLALLVAGNVALNVAFFATHPVFTQYYTIPIAMVSLWTLLFAAVFMREARSETALAEAVDGHLAGRAANARS